MQPGLTTHRNNRYQIAATADSRVLNHLAMNNRVVLRDLYYLNLERNS